jgi:hypothetical protein
LCPSGQSWVKSLRVGPGAHMNTALAIGSNPLYTTPGVRSTNVTFGAASNRWTIINTKSASFRYPIIAHDPPLATHDDFGQVTLGNIRSLSIILTFPLGYDPVLAQKMVTVEILLQSGVTLTSILPTPPSIGGLVGISSSSFLVFGASPYNETHPGTPDQLIALLGNETIRAITIGTRSHELDVYPGTPILAQGIVKLDKSQNGGDDIRMTFRTSDIPCPEAYECVTTTCNDISSSDPLSCGSNGTCYRRNTCICDTGYTGDLCEIAPVAPDESDNTVVIIWVIVGVVGFMISIVVYNYQSSQSISIGSNGRRRYSRR